jgi:hypothetical protein
VIRYEQRANTKGEADLLDHVSGSLDDIEPGESEHCPSLDVEVVVAFRVPGARSSPRIPAGPVDLDDHSLVRVDEIDSGDDASLLLEGVLSSPDRQLGRTQQSNKFGLENRGRDNRSVAPYVQQPTKSHRPRFALYSKLLEAPLESWQANLVRAEGIVQSNLEHFLINHSCEIEQDSCRRCDGNATQHLDIALWHLVDEVQDVIPGRSQVRSAQEFQAVLSTAGKTVVCPGRGVRQPDVAR